MEGLEFKSVSEGDFRDFARHHATSPEIGRIGTYLDDTLEVKGEPRLFGLYGCTELCAAVCCWVGPSNIGDVHVCKLDSVIVHDRLRKRGLGSILVYQAFLDVVTEPGLEIAKIYTHAVHPATVRMLSRLQFSKPPPLGAPLCGVDLSGANRERFINLCRKGVVACMTPLKLQCSFCKKGDRRARPWCKSAIR
jgi:GNAT superfamily N-acetyltransferase